MYIVLSSENENYVFLICNLPKALSLTRESLEISLTDPFWTTLIKDSQKPSWKAFRFQPEEDIFAFTKSAEVKLQKTFHEAFPGFGQG
jgi:hypothetical protein